MKYRKEAVHATNPEVLAAGRRKLAFATLAVLASCLSREYGCWRTAFNQSGVMPMRSQQQR